MTSSPPASATRTAARLLDSSTPLPEVARPLYLYAHTAVRMDPRQIVGVADRVARERLLPRLPVDFDERYERRVPAEPPTTSEPIRANTERLRSSLDDRTRATYRDRARSAAEGTPTFLNRTIRVDDESSIAWYDDRYEGVPLLWPLKLMAFEPLADLVLGVDPSDERADDLRRRFDDWVLDWIESSGIGQPRYLRRGWTPWTVSLRIQNWIRYAAWRRSVLDDPTPEFSRTLDRAIYKNALFLSNHVEWDVGGNHLVENGAALVAAGAFFEGAGRNWLDEGTSILAETGSTQFLDDGCHFERSPMYHVLTLTRLLTGCDLLERSDRPVPTAIGEVAAAASGFLRSIRPPDGRIPLLNDSVYGQALPLDACLRYADAVGVDRYGTAGVADVGDPELSELGESGYRWLRTDAGAMLFDGGDVGPPHIPAHSHSDTLGVLLWIDGSPVVSDTGTYGYVSGPRRQYARGVGGHSTVQVGDSEPIEIGGKYLMGERPDPEFRVHRGEVTLVEGRYESASPFAPEYAHHRAAYAGEDWWLVRDTVTGADGAPVRSRFTLDPGVDPSVGDPANGEPIRLPIEDGPTAFLYALDAADATVIDGRQFPRFGEEVDRRVLDLSATLGSPATVDALVTTRALDGEAVIEGSGEGSATLALPDRERRLPGRRLSLDG